MSKTNVLLVNVVFNDLGLHFVEVGQDLPLHCNNNYKVNWIFESYESWIVRRTFKKISRRKYLTVRNMDYLNTGNYYCHGATTPLSNNYLVYQFSVVVNGMKVELLKYFKHNIVLSIFYN